MSVPLAPPPRRRFNDDGFSLMEIVVSLGVFAAIATAGVAVMHDTLGTSQDNRERVRAANLADQEIERVRAAFRVAPNSVVDDLDDQFDVPVEFGGNTTTYSVVRDVTWRKTGTAGGTYTWATGDQLLVEVRVRWQSMREGRPPVINTTVLS